MRIQSISYYLWQGDMRFYFFLIWYCCSACLTEQDCLVTASDKFYVLFKTDTTNQAAPISLKQVNIEGIAAPIYTDDRAITQITLPLLPNRKEITYIFHQGNRVDSLTFSYRIAHRLISPSCGVYTFYESITPVKSTVKKVTIKNGTLSTAIKSNAEVVF